MAIMCDEVSNDFQVVFGRLPDPDDIQEASAFIKAVEVDKLAPAEAALVVHKPLSQLLANPLLRRWAEQVEPYYVGEPEKAHAFVVAGLFREAAEAETSRDRTAALGKLMQVPEFGFQQGPPQVSLTISESLMKLDVGRFPGEPEGDFK